MKHCQAFIFYVLLRTKEMSHFSSDLYVYSKCSYEAYFLQKYCSQLAHSATLLHIYFEIPALAKLALLTCKIYYLGIMQRVVIRIFFIQRYPTVYPHAHTTASNLKLAEIMSLPSIA